MIYILHNIHKCDTTIGSMRSSNTFIVKERLQLEPWPSLQGVGEFYWLFFFVDFILFIFFLINNKVIVVDQPIFFYQKDL